MLKIRMIAIQKVKNILSLLRIKQNRHYNIKPKLLQQKYKNKFNTARMWWHRDKSKHLGPHIFNPIIFDMLLQVKSLLSNIIY